MRVSKNESGVCASVQLMNESEIEGYIYIQTYIEIYSDEMPEREPGACEIALARWLS